MITFFQRGGSIIFLIFCSGCGEVKQVFGLTRISPDSFSVHPYSKPLEMPPDWQEGPVQAPCPLREAEKALLHRIQFLP